MADQRARKVASAFVSYDEHGGCWEPGTAHAAILARAYLALEAEYDSLRSVCARAKEECAKQEDKIAALEAENAKQLAFRDWCAESACSCGTSLDSMSSRDPDCIACAAKEALRDENLDNLEAAIAVNSERARSEDEEQVIAAGVDALNEIRSALSGDKVQELEANKQRDARIAELESVIRQILDDVGNEAATDWHAVSTALSGGKGQENTPA